MADTSTNKYELWDLPPASIPGVPGDFKYTPESYKAWETGGDGTLGGGIPNSGTPPPNTANNSMPSAPGKGELGNEQVAVKNTGYAPSPDDVAGQDWVQKLKNLESIYNKPSSIESASPWDDFVNANQPGAANKPGTYISQADAQAYVQYGYKVQNAYNQIAAELKNAGATEEQIASFNKTKYNDIANIGGGSQGVSSGAKANSIIDDVIQGKTTFAEKAQQFLNTESSPVNLGSGGGSLGSPKIAPGGGGMGGGGSGQPVLATVGNPTEPPVLAQLNGAGNLGAAAIKSSGVTGLLSKMGVAASVGSAAYAIGSAAYDLSQGADPAKVFGSTTTGLVVGNAVGTFAGTALAASTAAGTLAEFLPIFTIPGVGQVAAATLLIGAVATAAGTIAGTLGSNLFNTAYDSVNPATPQIAPAPPQGQLADAANLKTMGGQCVGVLYNVKIHAYFDIHYNPTDTDDGIIQLTFTGQATGPITGINTNIGWAAGFLPLTNAIGPNGANAGTLNYVESKKISGSGVYDYNRSAKVINVFVESMEPADGSPDNCGSPPAGSNLQYEPSSTPNIDYSPYNQALQQQPTGLGQQDAPPATPPLADKPNEQNKKTPKTVAIPPNTPAQLTPPGTVIPGSPNGTNISVNPDGSITVAPNGGQKYGVTTGGTEPVVVKTPGNQDITLDPTGQTPTQGAIPNAFNPTILKPNPLKASDPFVANTFKPNPLTPTAPFTPTSLKPTTENPTTQEPAQTSNPLLSPDPNIIIPAAVIAGLTPLLQNMLKKTNQAVNQTTPDKLSTAATTGVCNSTKPGGCNAGLNENAKGAADNSKLAAANTLGIAGDALATQTGLNQLKKAVGVGEFPATVPASLVTAGTGAKVATTSIPNLAKFQAWHVEQLDALMGAFAIPFTVAGKAMSIPNVAEGMAEQIGMQLVSVQNQEMLLNLCTRTIAEVGQIKQQQFKTYMAVEAIIEYLSFKHKEVQHSMPMSFVPGETNLLSLLKEATQTVSVIEFDDTVTQRTFLLDLARAAAITRAQGFRQINGTTDDEIKKEVLARIKGLSAYSDKLASQSASTQGKDDLDEFIKEIMTAPATGQNPYTCEGEDPPQITRKTPKKNP